MRTPQQGEGAKAAAWLPQSKALQGAVQAGGGEGGEGGEGGSHAVATNPYVVAGQASPTSLATLA